MPRNRPADKWRLVSAISDEAFPWEFEVRCSRFWVQKKFDVRSSRLKIGVRYFGPRTENLEPATSVKPSRLIMSAEIIDKPEDHFFRLACFLVHFAKLGVRNILLVFGNVKMTL
jgi:hypothetical protein